ncbi:MAG: RDD family protein [Nocardioidaceae bacterium]|nr:RDD family protein [Nocardioidaceae bacterium]NUS50388.1 RDD family protein [Nocardioidaceae bacterium]
MTGHGASVLPDEAEAFQGRPAGLVSRSVAAVIDGGVVGGALLAAYLGVSAALFAINPRGFTFPQSLGLFSLAVAWALAVVYLTIGWWIAGRTYGCAVMGLRVVGRGDRNIRFLPALVRAGLSTFFPIGLAWCAVDRKARAVHDLVTRSHVIYDWRHREE